MKKIITFLFCTSVISSAFAQTDSRDWNSRNANVNDYGNSNDYHNYDYQNIINQRDQEIQKMNYQNNWQVRQIVNNCDLNIWDKRDILNNLETQRIQNINNIYDRYSNTIAYYHDNERTNPFKHQRHNDDDRR
jgi:V8-like Glu-specific endopeptidase